ncbi:MAG: fused MFS/spermidine synthase [Candidatus Andersenbacteria bacterium]
MATGANLRWLRTVAFASGLVVLGVEVTAFRIVAPYFGSSIFTTTNLLGVILAALALGYWLGGRVADKQPDVRRSSTRLYQVLVAAAIVVAALPSLAPALLGWLRGMIVGLDWSLILVSLGGSALLFFVPFAVLGMVSPWLVRLATREVAAAGRTAGSLFAWSTLGSLLGTFVPTLLLVPLIGTKRTILLLAALLALVGAVGLVRRRWFVPAALLVALVPVTQPAYFAHDASVVAEREGATEYLRVLQDGRRTVLEQDEGFGVHSVYDPTTVVTGMVFDWFSLAPALRQVPASAGAPGRSLNVGIVGLAAGTVAREYGAFFGPHGTDPHDLALSGVELDPETLTLARRYFGFDAIEPPVKATAGDGRVWLTEQRQFDVLVVDAFRQLYIPPHLSSQEFFQLAAQHLAPGGVVVVNLNVVGASTLVEQKLAGTLRSVFPSVLSVHVPGSYNVLLFAAQHPLDPTTVAARTHVPELRSTAASFTQRAVPVQPVSDPWLIATDDRPLVESLYDAMVARAVFVQPGSIDATQPGR